MVVPHRATAQMNEHGWGQVIIAVRAWRCESCKWPMIEQKHLDKGVLAHDTTSVAGQLQGAGFKVRSGIFWSGELCTECAAKAASVFTCELCKQERPSDQVEEQFGDPAEYLCKPCYETVPASVWDAAKERLRRSHQYDHL
jgi:hypothetical protein